MFIVSVVSLDIILLIIGTTVEPYVLLPNQCVPTVIVLGGALLCVLFANKEPENVYAFRNVSCWSLAVCWGVNIVSTYFTHNTLF